MPFGFFQSTLAPQLGCGAGYAQISLLMLCLTLGAALVLIAFNERYWPQVEELLTTTDPLATFSVEKYGALAWVFRIGMSATLLSVFIAMGCT